MQTNDTFLRFPSYQMRVLLVLEEEEEEENGMPTKNGFFLGFERSPFRLGTDMRVQSVPEIEGSISVMAITKSTVFEFCVSGMRQKRKFSFQKKRAACCDL